MSCNGCRVLRKGCSDTCVLRHCLRCIDSPEAQGHATLFVTKFFGRAGLTGFINGVPENQRPALFQSLLYEACGRTVNPVYGAVGLLFSGNWAVCQAAVETVLRGGSPKPSVNAATGLQSIAALPCNSVSSVVRTAASISTVKLHLHAASGITNPNNYGLCTQTQHLPTTDQSFATTACSLRTNSTCLVNPNYLLDFCNYSGSSSAVHDTTNLNKRIRHWKTESVIKEDKDSMFKRPRSSLSFCAAADNIHDTAQTTASLRPSITSWVAGFKNSYSRGCSQDGCEALVDDVKQPGGRVHDVSLGGHVGYAPRGHVVAPVPRRVHFPPHMKQLMEDKDGMNEKLNTSMSVPNRLSSEECDNEAAHNMLSKGGLDQMESMISSGRLDDESEDAITKLDLALKAQPSTLRYQSEPNLQQEREFINHQEEPHEFLRVSSPSINSEGSVNTTLHVAGGSLNMMRSSSLNMMRSSSCFNLLESPKDGVKLLNLLL